MIDYSKVRGFNYQPSYGSTSLENWYHFDPHIFELEMRRGKDYFPGFNTVRYWLSWDAYVRRPEEFKANFEKSLDIADHLGIKVIPCLFNRWHDRSGYDNGGVYLENFALPNCWAYYRPLYIDYVKDIASAHANDPRILAWDLCNEPFSYTEINDAVRPFIQPEVDWLTDMYNAIKEVDPNTPIGVSVHMGIGLDLVKDISDVLMIHPYYICDKETIFDEKLRARFEQRVANACAYGRETGKPMFVTETCWGALTDEDRVEVIKYTLGILKKHDLGFVAHALHYSMVADLHYPEDGFLGHSHNLAFTTRDGKLRPGHEIFNEF